MAITTKFLRDIETEARPIIERQINDAKIIAGLRDVVSANGGDWGALKALIKARVEDDNDESGEGKRVRKIREKADCTVAYDDMLGSNMNENKNTAGQSYAEVKGVDAGSTPPHNPETGELTDTQEQPVEPVEAVESRIREGSPTGEAEDAGLAAGETAIIPPSGGVSSRPSEPAVRSSDESTATDATKAETMAGFASVQITHSPAPRPSQALQAKPETVSDPSVSGAISDDDVPAFLRKQSVTACFIRVDLWELDMRSRPHRLGDCKARPRAFGLPAANDDRRDHAATVASSRALRHE